MDDKVKLLNAARQKLFEQIPAGAKGDGVKFDASEVSGDDEKRMTKDGFIRNNRGTQKTGVGEPAGLKDENNDEYQGGTPGGQKSKTLKRKQQQKNKSRRKFAYGGRKAYDQRKKQRQQDKQQKQQN